jgi:phenylalanyl-tRNA synthetase beta chain
VPIGTEFINARLGFDLSAQAIQTLLGNVECSVATDGDRLLVTAPFWRTDIETREDVVEEVGRLYGFDKLPLELPKRSIEPSAKDPLLELKSHVRMALTKAGANEVLTYSFVHGDLLERVGQNPEHAFKVGNALSPDLQYYRLSLMPSLLDKIHMNSKAGYDEFALFELGKSHLADKNDDSGLPHEDNLTALVLAASDKLKKSGAAYYAARKYLTDLVPAKLTYRPVPADMQHYDITKPYDMNRSAFVYAGDTFLGIIGEFRSGVKRALKLPAYCAGFEVDTEALAGLFGGRSYVPLPRFPKVTQDITLKVPVQTSFSDLDGTAAEALASLQPQEVTYSLSPLGIYQPEADASHKNVSFRLEIASYQKTLTDKEVAGLLDAVAAATHEKFGAERV